MEENKIHATNEEKVKEANNHCNIEEEVKKTLKLPAEMLMFKVSEDTKKSEEGSALLEIRADMGDNTIVTLTIKGEKNG